MRTSIFAALGFALLVSAVQPRQVAADVSPAEATVVAKVGPRLITLDQVNRRIAALPPFQLRTFGKSADEVRRNFVEKVMIREALLVQGALDQKLDARDDVKDRIRGVMRSAMLGRVQVETASQSPVTEAEVKQYYEANPSKFHTPERIMIWRILVGTREEAAAILKEVNADPTPKRWNEIAREKSLDKATNMRGGNLGFVLPDGTTAEPGLRADRAVVAAAAQVKDAEIVPQPVQEGERFAVVWRRQSVKPVDRPLEAEVGSIRALLSHERAEKRTTALLEQLRRDHLRDYSPELIDLVEVAPSGELTPLRRPGTLAPRRPAASPTPADRGGVLR